MDNRFFERPILNSPYEYPARVPGDADALVRVLVNERLQQLGHLAPTSRRRVRRRTSATVSPVCQSAAPRP